MSSPVQERADAANDSYANRSQSDVDQKKEVHLNGQRYQVFGYANDPITGFHATAYRSVATPHEVIIAYRGTDPGLFSGTTPAEKKEHALTTVQDIFVDATMVRDIISLQKNAADAFTAAMIDKAAKQGIPKNHVFAAGHSLGGTLTEIEAAKYGLAGSTYNSYGAMGMLDGPIAPGCQLTNFRMAGDVVSAANQHVGETVSLASKDDVQSLRDGRYLDAPAAAPPPNVLIAMRLGDHGGQEHFDSKSQDNLLEPHHFKEAAQRYADNQAAFDHYSSDVSRERGELSQALRQMKAPHSQAHLPPDIQRQVNEYLVLHADQPIRNAIEQSGLVQGAEHHLQSGADAARANGHYVQTLDERVASAAREAGIYATPLNPLAPLAGLAAGEAAHLHGQAADATGRFVGDHLQSARGAAEQGVHNFAQTVVGVTHDPGAQARAANVINHALDAYQDVQIIAQTYEATKQAVSHGVDNTERAARLAYDTLTHPGQWFHHGASAEASHASSGTGTPSSTQAVTSTESNFARNDPRHPDNPQHKLYETLERRIPEASQNRLLQFTAACHEQGITEKNIGRLTLAAGEVQIQNRELGPPVQIDIKTNPPSPQESIKQIQQADLTQAHVQANIQQMNQQQNLQGQQGPMPGGGPR